MSDQGVAGAVKGSGETAHEGAEPAGLLERARTASEHRLAWWRARWNHQQRRQNTLPTDRPTVRPATGATGPRPEPRSNEE